jgi:hypothetical protein
MFRFRQNICGVFGRAICGSFRLASVEPSFLSCSDFWSLSGLESFDLLQWNWWVLHFVGVFSLSFELQWLLVRELYKMNTKSSVWLLSHARLDQLFCPIPISNVITFRFARHQSHLRWSLRLSSAVLSTVPLPLLSVRNNAFHRTICGQQSSLMQRWVLMSVCYLIKECLLSFYFICIHNQHACEVKNLWIC